MWILQCIKRVIWYTMSVSVKAKFEKLIHQVLCLKTSTVPLLTISQEVGYILKLLLRLSVINQSSCSCCVME